MRKWMIGAILSIAFAGGVFVYTKWEDQRFADSLPKPESQPVDASRQPQSPDDSVHTTSLSPVLLDESEAGAEKEVTAEQVSEDDTQGVDAGWQTDGVAQDDEARHTHDDHTHQPIEKPFAQEYPDPSEMDPDELADMLLKGLLQRFGDIPEVHTFIALTRKKFKNESLSLDEHIDLTAAQLYLFPDPETEKTLNIFLEKKASEYPGSTRIVR